MTSLVLVALLLCYASGQVLDWSTGEAVEENFLESGFVSSLSSSSSRVTVTTNYTFTRPVVTLSTVFSSDKYSNDIPVQARVFDLVHKEGKESTVTFTVSLVWPSNKTCVSDWYDAGKIEGTFSVGWYVAEAGAYSVSGLQMQFLKATATAQEFSFTEWPYTFGSDCKYPTESGDDDYSPGGMFTIQSNNNTGMFLTVRSSNWHKTAMTKCNYSWKKAGFRLYPHDFNSTVGLIDQSLIKMETIGIFLFDARRPQTVDCFGGSYAEIGDINSMDSSSHAFSTIQSIDTSSVHFGVFGSILTLTGGDSMVVMTYSFVDTPTDIYGYIQEDVCVDEETHHYTESFSYMLVTPSTSNCAGVDPIVGDHTYAPSSLPTALNAEEDSSSASNAKSGDVLLAVFLPICIIVVVAAVGYFTKKTFLKGRGDLDSSENSGMNLVGNNA